MDIELYGMLGFLSLLSVVVYFWFFSIPLKTAVYGILIGGPASFLIAMLLELFALSYFSLMLLIILIAPVIEESAKFVLTVKGGMKRGVAVGMGFAWLENILYYNSFFQIFTTLFFLREFSDPILHGTTTGLATKAWKGKVYWFGVAVLLHVAWNAISFIIITNPNWIFLFVFIYGAILYIGLKKDVKINKMEK
jgi:RsiW-degrading membrane proteinase PrsW (M82 family)